ATDPASGDIEQYDRGRGTWTRIGYPGSGFAATGDHLYGVSVNHFGVFEYTGAGDGWTQVRGATDRVFTSRTTLYATDLTTGDIEQYDRGRGTWTRIGG
ncbi:hypothetical protein, partial [Kitasatospora aureofaciens]|uniref:hypothetical protein n=1 Tax=Kitasatospora aureofaciens TaxID=1894 RepID=UPI0005262DA7